MAGSLSHIIDADGRFTMELIDNMGDAHEALEECFALILELSEGDMAKVSAVCRKHRFPDPWSDDRFDDDPKPQAMRL